MLHSASSANRDAEILVTTAGTQREALFAQTSAQLAILRKYSTSYSKHLVSSASPTVAGQADVHQSKSSSSRKKRAPIRPNVIR